MANTPLERKLGLKPGMHCYLVHEPGWFTEWISKLNLDLNLKTNLRGTQLDFIIVFCSDQQSLEQNFNRSKEGLKNNAALWVSWPKKSSGIKSDLNREIIRDYGLANGLVDTKIASVDEKWSALKFVYRLKDRH